MPDKELILEILSRIEESSEKIVTRFMNIHNVSDFTDSPAGVDKMDSIAMMLIVVGESLKNLDKVTDGTLLSNYPEVDWKRAKGMRDILTHHYAGMDCTGLINATFYGEDVTNPRISTATWPGNVSGWYKVGEGLNVAKDKDLLLWTTVSGDKRNHMAFYAGENKLFHSSTSYGVAHTNNLELYWIKQGKPDVYREVGY